jgi:hypothetical protein
MDSERRNRIKRSEALEVVCKLYDTTPDASQVLVAEGRKALHVLSYGKIDSPRCFFPVAPVHTFRANKSTWHCIVIPNGWKVAVFVRDDLWIAETCYDPDLQFQFSRLDEVSGEVVESTGWFKNPSAAFNTRNVSHKDKGPLRHNGKLFVGVHYEGPQAKIREHFAQTTFPDDLLPFVKSWLQGSPLPEVELVLVGAGKRPRTSSSHAFQLYDQIISKHPSTTFDAVMDAISLAPYVSADRPIKKEDFIEFVERIDDVCIHLVAFARIWNVEIIRDQTDMIKLQPFFMEVRSTIRKRAVDFIQQQLRKYLIVRGVLNLTGDEDDVVRKVTGLPLARELL